MLMGCTAEDPSAGRDLPSFSSLDEAYAAVDQLLGCESAPAGQPIVPVDNAQLTSEQRLCAEHVQVDMYPDRDYLQRSLDIVENVHQGEAHLVHGENWMVLDITEIATDESTAWDLEQLAQDLDGEYLIAGTS